MAWAAGCAVSLGALVGLDIESAERLTRKDPLALARRYFSPSELAALEGEDAVSASRTSFRKCYSAFKTIVSCPLKPSRLDVALHLMWLTRGDPMALACHGASPK